jgi:hypothetical protein
MMKVKKKPPLFVIDGRHVNAEGALKQGKRERRKQKGIHMSEAANALRFPPLTPPFGFLVLHQNKR